MYACWVTPMREPTYFILASLLDEPRHGYAVIQRVHELSNGRIKLAAGTLYGALDRLSEQQLVEDDGEELVDGRVRRYYRITKTGRTAVAEEALRLAEASSVVARLIPSIKPRPDLNWSPS